MQLLFKKTFLENRSVIIVYKSTHNGLSATKKKVISLALCAAVTASAFAVIGLTSSNTVSASVARE